MVARGAVDQLAGAHMLHIKIDTYGQPVSSGGPSCWQCSRLVADEPLEAFWLLEEQGWTRYTPQEFHRATLRHHGLPIITR